jgi:hypothetical protein
MKLRILALFAIFLVAVLCGCGKGSVSKALQSDANGYVCSACQARFYTDRSVFADRCPQCRNVAIQPVLGYLCPADQHTTLAPRGRVNVRCEKCGGATSGLSIPGEKEYQAWGAAKKSKNEVSGS